MRRRRRCRGSGFVSVELIFRPVRRGDRDQGPRAAHDGSALRRSDLVAAVADTQVVLVRRGRWWGNAVSAAVLDSATPGLLSFTWSDADTGVLGGSRVLDLADMDRFLAAVERLHAQWHDERRAPAARVAYVSTAGGRSKLDLAALLDDLFGPNQSD